MSTMSIRLPKSLHRTLRDVAGREGVSMNQFVTLAVAEKLSALATEEVLRERGARASRSRYEAALAEIPDRPAEPHDARE